MENEAIVHLEGPGVESVKETGSGLLPELNSPSGLSPPDSSADVILPRADVLAEYEGDNDALSSGGEGLHTNFIDDFIADSKTEGHADLGENKINGANSTKEGELLPDFKTKDEPKSDSLQNTEDLLDIGSELTETQEIKETLEDTTKDVIIPKKNDDASETIESTEKKSTDIEESLSQKDLQKQEDAIEDSRFEKDIAATTNNETKPNNDEVGNNVGDDDFDDDDDDFDDFNEFQGSTDFENPIIDDVEFSASTDTTGVFPESLFKNLDAYRSKLDDVLASIFDDLNVVDSVTNREAISLLDDRSRQVSEEIARLPRLKPPNWTRLIIRHNLLISLGIPINLDETAGAPAGGLLMAKSGPSAHKIDWKGLPVPAFEALNLEQAAADEILAKSAATLSRIDVDNLTNSTAQFLQTQPESVVDAKLELFKSNYTELLTLASVWQHQLEEQTKNTEIYGEVVQSMIGYSHKKQREEIMEEKRRK